jgi:hypothetical protein
MKQDEIDRILFRVSFFRFNGFIKGATYYQYK